MTMTSCRLPRGIEGAYAPSTAATATWATRATINRFSLTDGGFYLGAQTRVPASALALTRRLESLIRDLTDAHAIHADWREQQIRVARQHIAALHTDVALTGIENDMHIITVAGTRGGKGTTSIIPNLIRYQGSVICIDPKGENARITATRRGPGTEKIPGLNQRVYVLDPYRVSGVDDALQAAFNPLDFIDLNSPEVYDQAASIIENIIVRSSTGGEAVHFDDNATTLAKGLTLYVKMTRQGRDDCNLLTVRRLLMEGIRAEPGHDQSTEDEKLSPIRALLAKMEQTADPAGVIAASAATLLDMGDKEFGGVLSTARRNFEFLEKQPIARVLDRSTFSIDELKTAPEGASIYLCLPPQHMHSVGRWLRLMIGLTMERMYVLPTPARPPVLFLLEEFHTLGHMPVIETAIAYAAGFGVRFHVILQDLNQLKRHYPKSWETFIGNAGVLQVFAINDTTTLDYVSKRIGDIEITQSTRAATTSHSVSTNDASAHEKMQTLFQNRGPLSAFLNPIAATADHSKATNGYNTTASQNDAPKVTRLIRPEEIEQAFRREAMAALIIIAGEQPFAIARLNYYAATAFAGLYSPAETQRFAESQPVDPITAAEHFEQQIRASITAALPKTGTR